MKFLTVFFLSGMAALAACSTTANNGSGNAANMRGANTNTGYLTNSNANVRPAMPVNVTNISPPSMNSVTGNRNSAVSNTRSSPAGTRKP